MARGGRIDLRSPEQKDGTALSGGGSPGRGRAEDHDRLEGFGAFVRERRRRLGLTQTQLAQRLGWMQERVSLIENAKYGMPSLPGLERVARTLDVSLAELLRVAGYDVLAGAAPGAAGAGIVAGDGSEALLLTLQRLLYIRARTLRDALEQVADLLHVALGAEKVDAFVLLADGHTLQALGVSDTPLGRLERSLGLDRISIEQGGTIARTFLTGDLYLSGDIRADSGVMAQVRDDLGVRSALEVPFRIHGEVRGVLAATSTQEHRFDADDCAFLLSVAGWVSLLVEGVELRAQRDDLLSEAQSIIRLLLDRPARGAMPGDSGIRTRDLITPRAEELLGQIDSLLQDQEPAAVAP